MSKCQIRFNIHYVAAPDECLVVLHETNTHGELDAAKAFPLKNVVGGVWEGTLEVATKCHGAALEYAYAIAKGRAIVRREGGRNRLLARSHLLPGLLDVFDTWKVRLSYASRYS